jgi:hypothetical protein
VAKVTKLEIELEQEEDGRWIGGVPALPGVMAYGQTKAAAIAAACFMWLTADPEVGILSGEVTYGQTRIDRTAN